MKTNKKKETKMKTKKLETIEIKENERMQIKLPCGASIDVFTSDNGALIEVNHFRTNQTDTVNIKSCGYKSSQNYSWTEATTEFSSKSGYVTVQHVAHNK